jgi:hypothetical protein
MRCLICSGRGWVRNEASNAGLLPAVPCPRCGGSGWDHCCEGSDASCEVQVREPKPALFEPRLPFHELALRSRDATAHLSH